MIDEATLPPRDHSARAPVPAMDEPSSGGRLLLGWILIAASVVMLVIGWVGVSANPHVAVQLSYFFSGGLGGLLAGIIGVGLLVSDDIRRDRARIGTLEARVLEMHDLLVAQAELLREPRAVPEAARRTRRPGGGHQG